MVSDTNDGPEYISNSKKDYFVALDRWLQDACLWYNVTASFPYMFMSNQLIPMVDQNGFVHRLGTRPAPFGFPNNFPESPNTPTLNARPAQQVPPHNYHETPTQRQHAAAPRIDGVQCRIAPIWKRFVAEFIDFLILFFLKLAATFVAIDFFDFINLDKYGLELFTQALDYKSFMELTTEILILEIIHRIVVCIFEAFWLQHGSHGLVGGATPGKALMGLRVIRCDEAINIIDRPLDVILVKPGSDLGLRRSITRAILKNFVSSVLFPFCVFFMFFKHNQTAYDVLSKSIVVEIGVNHRP